MEYLQAIATIDYGYFLLRKINDDMKNRSPIIMAIDKATGYDDEFYKEMIPVLEDIIEAKKSINEDYSLDNKMLEKIKEVLKV